MKKSNSLSFFNQTSTKSEKNIINHNKGNIKYNDGEIMMKQKKIFLPISIGAIILVSMFSGCVGPWAVDTLGWDHINEQGTAVRIWGQLTITESHENWNEYLVWDTERHDDWRDYEFREPADNYGAAGTFSKEITGLDRHTEYHYRAVGEYLKAQDQIRWGADHTFIPGGPRVWTDNISYLGLTSATLEGDLWHLGGANSVDCFFRYGTDIDNLNMESTHTNMTSIGKFSSTITGLTSNQTVFFKAVAINDADTWDGLIFNFNPGRPIVDTLIHGQVTSTTAVLKGNLWHTGGTPTCEVWFAYSDKSQNDLTEKSSVLVRNTTGQFEIQIDGLTPGTRYWYRAIADNGVAQDNDAQIEDFLTSSGDIIYDNGETSLKHLQNDESSSTSLIDRIPAKYQQFLEKHPIILRLLEHRGLRYLISTNS